MSAVTKNLRVHFDDDLPTAWKAEPCITKLDQNQNTATVFKYSRDELLELKKHSIHEPEKLFNDIQAADEKRKEKIKFVFRKEKVLKLFNNPKAIPSDGTVMPFGDAADKNVVHSANDKDRTNFRQMIEAAVSSAQQHNNAGNTAKDNRRQRFGSGRIPDNCAMKEPQMPPIGIDVRYMNNELFRDLKDMKSGGGGGSGGSGGSQRVSRGKDDHTPFNWQQARMYETASSDNDNTDARSDEPEWANCGPISKNDIIELHGFDGPIDDDKSSDGGTAGGKPSDTLHARSTPSKAKASQSGKVDEYFNFEEFLKLDLPATVSGSRDNDTAGESRFTQWFGRNNSPNHSRLSGSGFFDTKGKANAGSGHFLNWQQKSNLKKMQSLANLANATKFRSVEELEANMYPNKGKAGPAKPLTDAVNFQALLNGSGIQAMQPKPNVHVNSAQANFLLNLINRNTEEMYQQRLTKSAAMQRPDAQLMIHRLVNGELTQLHILQQINNPTVHQRDRETFIAVLNFCNENQQWLLQQQQQQLKQKERMQFQLRQLQMLQLHNGRLMGMAGQSQYDPQHARSQMNQNSLLTKPFGDQRKSYNSRSGAHLKWNNNNNNNHNNHNNNNINNNHSMGSSYYFQANQKLQSGQHKPLNGLQFIQSQMNQSHGRQDQFNASGPANAFGENNANVDYVASIVNK